MTDEENGFETRGELRVNPEAEAAAEALDEASLDSDIAERTQELAENADELAEQAHELAEQVANLENGEAEEGFPTERES